MKKKKRKKRKRKKGLRKITNNIETNPKMSAIKMIKMEKRIPAAYYIRHT